MLDAAVSAVIVNECSPSMQALGSINALSLATQSGTRAFMPAASNALYAVGVRSWILWGQLVWAGLIGLSVLLGVCTWTLPVFVNEDRRAKNAVDSDEPARDH